MKRDFMNMLSKLSIALCVSVGFAMAEDSTIVERQQGLIETLDSMNSSVMGLRLGGTAKAGVLSSTASSDQLANGSDHRETQAYTDVNLKVTARPSSETEARAEVRLHRDWQSAYDESWNPVLGHWFSSDGKILDKHVDFNLGYMRVGYTPLTLFVPQTEILQEPDIFAQKRMESLALRNLDTSSNRLMQGLNARFNSFAVGPLSNIYAQVTGARMRAVGKKVDQVFFDFDWSDRYFAGANAGVEAFGFTLGGNFVTTFDREKSSKATNTGSDLFYEENKVYTGIVGFNSKELIDLPVHFGINAEMGRSHWNYEMDTHVPDTVHNYAVYPFFAPHFDENGAVYETVMINGVQSVVPVSDTSFYVVDSFTVDKKWKHKFLDKKKGMALSITPFVEGEMAGFDFNVKGTFTKNDENFWSEQASSNYLVGGRDIFNAEASITGVDESVLEHFRSGSLENMYFSIYNTNVLQQQNLMNKHEGDQLVEANDSKFTYGRLFNNYKIGHFYKNGYQAYSSKYMEMAVAREFMDPSVNMAMPMGLATPDRMGFAVSGDIAWNDAVVLNLRFAKYNEDEIDNEYTQMGAGLMVDVAPIIGLDRRIKLQGSFEKGEEDAYLKRKTSRIVGGATIDIWGPFALLGGVQLLNKEYGRGLTMVATTENSGTTILEDDEGNKVARPSTETITNTVSVKKTEEMLAMGGLQIKMGAGAYLNLQGGLLTNTVKYTQQITSEMKYNGLDNEPVDDFVEGKEESFKLDVDKMLLMADVTVLF